MTGEATGPLGRARALLGSGGRHRPSSPTHVVIDSSLTDVWRRRVLAAVIDLGLVLVVLATLTLLQVQRLTRDSAGLLSPADIDRWNTLAAMPNRHVGLGSTTYVLAGAELILSVLITVALALAVFVLIPAYTGTSPGKRLCGLRLVTIHGGVVGLPHTALRTAVGVVDFLPGLVPWALGARLAQASPWHQRLGDRVAGTAVIDTRRLLTVTGVGPKAATVPAAGRTGTTTTRSAPSRSPLATRATEGTEPPPLRTAVAETTAADSAAATPAAVGAPAPASSAPSRSPRPSAVEAPGTAAVTAELFAPVPDASAGTAPGARRTPPPPQHRRSTPVAATSGATEARTDSGWVAPRAEPAPVWDPTPDGQASSRAWLGNLAAALSPTTADAPSAATPLPVPAGAGEDPVWNDEWQAWLYFDREHGRWIRHDAATDAWVSIG